MSVTTAAGPAFADADANAINRAACEVLAERADALGDTEAGLYGYYRQLLDRGSVLQPFEVRLADAVLTNTPAGTPVVDIGAGTGVLSAYFAAKGRSVIAFERDPRRHATSRAVLDAVDAVIPGVGGLVDLRGDSFPQGAEDLPHRAVAVFTNIVGTTTVEQRDAVLAAVAPFSWVVLDAQRFFFDLPVGETMPTLQAVWATGFRRLRPLVDLGPEAEYYLVEGPALPSQSKV